MVVVTVTDRRYGCMRDAAALPDAGSISQCVGISNMSDRLRQLSVPVLHFR